MPLNVLKLDSLTKTEESLSQSNTYRPNQRSIEGRDSLARDKPCCSTDSFDGSLTAVTRLPRPVGIQHGPFSRLRACMPTEPGSRNETAEPAHACARWSRQAACGGGEAHENNQCSRRASARPSVGEVARCCVCVWRQTEVIWWWLVSRELDGSVCPTRRGAVDCRSPAPVVT